MADPLALQDGSGDLLVQDGSGALLEQAEDPTGVSPALLVVIGRDGWRGSFRGQHRAMD